MTTRSGPFFHHTDAKLIQPPTPHKESTQRRCQHPSAIADSQACLPADPVPMLAGLTSRVVQTSGAGQTRPLPEPLYKRVHLLLSI